MNGDEKRTLVVLDPAWQPMEPRSYAHDDAGELRRFGRIFLFRRMAI